MYYDFDVDTKLIPALKILVSSIFYFELAAKIIFVLYVPKFRKFLPKRCAFVPES